MPSFLCRHKQDGNLRDCQQKIVIFRVTRLIFFFKLRLLVLQNLVLCNYQTLMTSSLSRQIENNISIVFIYGNGIHG